MWTAASPSLAPNIYVSISALDQSSWLTPRAYARAANRSLASARTDESATYERPATVERTVHLIR